MENSNLSIGNYIVRKGRPEDVSHFVNLFVSSSPLHKALWGDKCEPLLSHLFPITDNLYSYTHSYFIEVNGKVAGMFFRYDYSIQNREQENTRKLMMNFSYLEYYSRFFKLLKIHRIFGGLEHREYLVSNVAVYSEYRRMGLFGVLMNEVAKSEAMHSGNHRMIAYVLKDNSAMISCLTSFGWKIEKDFDAIIIGNQHFKFILIQLTLYD
jgi:ribosomal protein S18 acetylase RimI-like enzyme